MLTHYLAYVLAGAKVLRDHGVSIIKELRSETIDSGDATSAASATAISASGGSFTDNIIYLVRPHLPLIKMVAKQVQAYIKAGLQSAFIFMHFTFHGMSQELAVNFTYISFLIEQSYVNKF